MTVTDGRHRNTSRLWAHFCTDRSHRLVKEISGCGCSHCPKQQCENKLWLHTGLRWHGSGTNSWSLLCERSCRFGWNHLDHQPLVQALRVVDFLEHQLTRDGRLCAVYFGRTTLKCWNHLLHHLVKEDMSKLRVEEGTELERDLRRENGEVPKFSPQPKTWSNRINSSRHIWGVQSSMPWKCILHYVKRISLLTLHATYAELNFFRRKTEFEIKNRHHQCWHFWSLRPFPSTHRKIHCTGTRVARDAGAETPNGLQVVEQFGLWTRCLHWNICTFRFHI